MSEWTLLGGGYEPQGEDMSALWAQQEEELRRQQQLQAAAQVVAGDIPYPSTLTAAGLEDRQAPPDTLRGQLLNPGNFQGYVNTLPQGQTVSPLQTAAQVAAGPAQVLGGLYNAVNVDIPIISPAVREAAPYIAEGIDAGGASNQIINRGLETLGVPEPIRMPSPFTAFNYVANQFGAPSVGQGVTDVTVGSGGAADLAFMFAPGVGDIPLDDIARGLGRARGLTEDIVRAGMPEPMLNPGLGGGPSRYSFEDYLRGNATPTGGEWNQYAFRGPVGEPSPNYPLPVDPNDPLARSTAQQILAQQTDELARIGPHPIDLQYAQNEPLVGQSGIPVDPEVARMDAEFDQMFRNAPEGSVMQPPQQAVPTEGQVIRLAVAPDAVTPLDPNSLTGSRGAVELSNPGAARILAPGESPAPGELEMFHGTGNAGIQGELQAGMNLSPRPEDAQVFARTAAKFEGLSESAAPNVFEPPLTYTNRPTTVSRESWQGQPPPILGAASPARLLPEANIPPPAAVGSNLPDYMGRAMPTPNPTALAENAARPLPESNSQRMSRLINETQQSDIGQIWSKPQSLDEAEQAANAIGFPFNREEYNKLNEPSKALEQERLDAAIDLHNFRVESMRGGSALDSYVAAVKADGTRTGVAAPPASVAANPQAATLWDNIMDLAYGPLQMDVGTPLRQDLTAMLDLTKVFQTRDVLADAVRAATSRNEALKVVGELDALKAAADAKIGKTIDVQRPDIPGIRQTKGNVNREVMQSNLFGRIPGLGLPYNVTGRANAVVLDSRRVREYANFVDNLPNRAFGPDKSKWAAHAQYFANQRAVTSGRGSLGSGQLEKSLAGAGPVFTSLRYLLSIPQRVPYLLPVNRIAKGEWSVMGPAWREAAKEHAFFAGLLVGTYVAADQLGANIKDAAGDYTGKIKVGSTTFDLTAGMAGYWNAINKMADGDLMAGAEFLRNKTGPLVQGAAQAARLLGAEGEFIDFMRPEWFDRGATGSGTPADRAAAMIIPLWMQSVAQAVRAANNKGENPLVMGAATGLANFFGVNTSSNQGTILGNLRAGYKDDPRLPEAIRGKDYKDLGRDGKDAVDALAKADNPEKFAQGERERDKNSDPAFRRYHQQKDALDDKVEQAKDKLLERLADPSADAIKVREQRSGVSKEYREEIQKLQNDKSYKDALKGLPTSELQTYLNEYNSIPSRLTTNGKIDWDAVERVQTKYLAAIDSKSPEAAKLLRFEVETRTNEHPLDRLYRENQPLIEQYFQKGTDSASRAAALRQNPRDDAKLAYLGYGRVHSTEAQVLLDKLRAAGPMR